VLDSSIGQAVQTYASEQAAQVKKQREEYLSFIVHDLRTPLNSIAMAGQLLERRTRNGIESSADFTNILSMLRGNVSTLSSLVAQILEENISLVSHAGTKIENRLFGLWGLVESVLHDLSPVSETRSCKLVNLVPYDLNVYGDSSLLIRVFRNLIANALKYTPEGEIEVGAIIRGEEGAVECWVKDTGSGIPEALLANIFEKLETDPTRDDGTGLGLAIVETFIKAHNGEVRVESKEGVGTTFHIFLPGKSTESAENKS
jgi:signal transduction histidine kinase